MTELAIAGTEEEVGALLREQRPPSAPGSLRCRLGLHADEEVGETREPRTFATLYYCPRCGRTRTRVVRVVDLWS